MSQRSLIEIPAGKIFILQGSPGNALLVLKEGSYELIGSVGGDDKLIAREHVESAGRLMDTVSAKDSFIGETGIILGRHLGSYRAGKNGAKLGVLPINLEKTTMMVLKTPALGIAMAKNIAARLLEVNKKFSSAVGKIAKYQKQLEEFQIGFYKLVEGIVQDAQDEKPIEDAYKKAKIMDTYKQGRKLVEAQKETQNAFRSAISMSTHGTQVKTVKRDEVLCNEGDEGDEMWILTKGELWVYIGGQKIGEIAQGEIVGEMIVLLENAKRRTAQLKAVQNCSLGVIPKNSFEKVALTQPKLTFSLCRMLSVRLRNTIQVLLTADTSSPEAVDNFLQRDHQTSIDYGALYEGIKEYDDVLYRECDELVNKKEAIDKMLDEFKTEYGLENAAAVK
ncbi:MAG: cyclic nucleotide-binding domain-containing protein [Planctomycetes bacterium]|nr:cyclic nucleotide-binding domain-containing protein [Planctomycetota bacterium]